MEPTLEHHWITGGIQISRGGVVGESLEIPDTIEGRTVTSIGPRAFKEAESLQEIILPNSIQSIGEDAFTGCLNLRSVRMKPGLKVIGAGAFRDCSSLTVIEIPKTVESIGEQAFSGCESITKVVLPELVRRMGSRIFQGCSQLVSVTIAASVTKMGDALAGCTGLRVVEIPEGVTHIGSGAFKGCSGLETVILPRSLETVGAKAFDGCDQLAVAVVPDQLFKKTVILPILGSVEPWVELVFLGFKKLRFHVVISKDTTEIQKAEFSDQWRIERIQFSDSVTKIGDSAFLRCSGLVEVLLPESIIEIGRKAFYRCESLTSLRIPRSVELIGPEAIGRCSRLKSISVDPANRCFSDFDGMLFDRGIHKLILCPRGKVGEIHVPDTVSRICENAFSDCSSLIGISLPLSLQEIEWGAFFGCESLEHVSVDPASPYFVTLDGVLFDKNLTKLILCPKSMSGDYAVPDSVEHIESHAFADCRKITSIKLPNALVEIGAWAFARCAEIFEISTPGAEVKMGAFAVEGCDKLSSSGWREEQEDAPIGLAELIAQNLND